MTTQAAAATTTTTTTSQPAATPAAAAPPAAAADPGAGSPPATPAQPSQQEQEASRHFAALAKREKAIRERELALKDRESKYTDYETKEKLRRENPDALLSDYGYTLDDLIKRKANGGKLTAEQLAQKAIDDLESLKKERAEDQKRQDEAKKQRELEEVQEREAQAIAGMKEKISGHIKANPADHEFLLEYDDGDPSDLVYAVMDHYYEETKKQEGTGRILSFEEAAKYAEKALREDAEKKAQKFEKFKSKTPPKDPETPAPAPAEGKKPSTTLSSELSGGGTPPKQESDKPMDPRQQIEESKRKAAALLRWGPKNT